MARRGARARVDGDARAGQSGQAQRRAQRQQRQRQPPGGQRAVGAGDAQQAQHDGSGHQARTARVRDHANDHDQQPIERVVARHHGVLEREEVRAEQQHLERARERREAQEQQRRRGHRGDDRDVQAGGAAHHERPEPQVPEPQGRVPLVDPVAADQVGKAVGAARQAPGMDLVAPELVVQVDPDQIGQVDQRGHDGEGPSGFVRARGGPERPRGQRGGAGRACRRRRDRSGSCAFMGRQRPA